VGRLTCLFYLTRGESPTSPIRPPSHAWRARQDSKSGQRGASGTKRPLGRSAAPTESPLHAPRACLTLRDSLSPHAGIGGNAWGTAPRSKRRPNVGRLLYYETRGFVLTRRHPLEHVAHEVGDRAPADARRRQGIRRNRRTCRSG